MLTPEVYEILEGGMFVYMQEKAERSARKCYAVEATQVDIVVVLPEWGHCTINASSDQHMYFGAWCVRDDAFDYTTLKKPHGFAYSLVFDSQNYLTCNKNNHYTSAEWLIKRPREYREFGIGKRMPIYYQYEQNPNLFDFINHPEYHKDKWAYFIS